MPPAEELFPREFVIDLGEAPKEEAPKKEEEKVEVKKEEKEEAEKITRPIFLHGRKSNIGPTPVRLLEENVKLLRGIDIWADIKNTDVVYIGREGMNLDEADINCGFPLYPNSSKFIEAEKVNMVYVASKTPGQRVYWEGI